ncbi:MAG: hypothetical protein WC533_00865 [Candidatus Pacearchaeota archaeon]
MAQIIEECTLPDGRRVYRAEAPLDEQLKLFKEKGIRYPISIRDMAYGRSNGKLMKGTRTCHAPIYAPNSEVVVAMVSPLVKNQELAEQAVQAHKENRWFVRSVKLYETFREQAEIDKDKSPEKRRAVILPSRQTFYLGGDSYVSETLFRDMRERYFNDFAKREKLKFFLIPKGDVDSLPEDKCILNYLWFGSADYDSGVDGDRGLNCSSRAFGVSESAPKAHARKKLLPRVTSPYSPKQLAGSLKIVQGVRSGNLPALKLEKVVEFLAGLENNKS